MRDLTMGVIFGTGYETVTVSFFPDLNGHAGEA